jgi:hypothetical protein
MKLFDFLAHKALSALLFWIARHCSTLAQFDQMAMMVAPCDSDGNSACAN